MRQACLGFLMASQKSRRLRTLILTQPWPVPFGPQRTFKAAFVHKRPHLFCAIVKRQSLVYALVIP